MKLYEIAHSRAGDKGNTSTLSLIPFKRGLCAFVRKNHGRTSNGTFKNIVAGSITRYELPNISSLLFVCELALLTGVTTSLALDAHGKALSYALLEMDVS